MMPVRDPVRIAKPFVFALGMLPILWLGWAFLIALGTFSPSALNGGLGVNAPEFIRNFTGEWTLRLLVATLIVTPLRQITGWNSVIRFRRMIGLFAFFYGVVHFVTYLLLDVALDMNAIVEDVLKRPFITAGFLSFVLMIPLGVTSTKKWIARLGGRRWQKLHWLIYPSAIAGVVHYYWRVKLDVTPPLIYAAVFAVLLAYRALKKMSTSPTHGASAAAR
jgi:sulfoxide reductase heme-binding subunit YedZ